MISIDNVCSNGLKHYYKDRPDLSSTPPNPEEVELCRDFLRTYCKPSTKGRGSYPMKHTVERVMGQYVSNGALIVAAIMEGYEQRPTDGPNTYILAQHPCL